jgi:hypothetical protein
MAARQTVIYVANSAGQAYLLRNLLAEQGIQAVVINQALERGFGVGYAGWSALPRVVVDEVDARLAREIAMRHDHQGAKMALAERPRDGGPALEAGAVPEDWPRCPSCGEPRVTRCPICKTTGVRFAEADDEHVWGVGLDEPSEASSCGCGHGVCGGRPGESDTGETESESASGGEPRAADVETPERLVLVCPTCSEPFVPEFPRRCAWCGHEFPEGFEPENIVEPMSQLNGRVVAILLLLLALVVAVVVYFMVIL